MHLVGRQCSYLGSNFRIAFSNFENINGRGFIFGISFQWLYVHICTRVQSISMHTRRRFYMKFLSLGCFWILALPAIVLICLYVSHTNASVSDFLVAFVYHSLPSSAHSQAVIILCGTITWTGCGCIVCHILARTYRAINEVYRFKVGWSCSMLSYHPDCYVLLYRVCSLCSSSLHYQITFAVYLGLEALMQVVFMYMYNPALP